MIIYIALVKSEDNKPSRLIVRDDPKDMKDYLLSIPAVYAIDTFAEYDTERGQVSYHSLKSLVKFLR